MTFSVSSVSLALQLTLLAYVASCVGGARATLLYVQESHEGGTCAGGLASTELSTMRPNHCTDLSSSSSVFVDCANQVARRYKKRGCTGDVTEDPFGCRDGVSRACRSFGDAATYSYSTYTAKGSCEGDGVSVPVVLGICNTQTNDKTPITTRLTLSDDVVTQTLFYSLNCTGNSSFVSNHTLETCYSSTILSTIMRKGYAFPEQTGAAPAALGASIGMSALAAALTVLVTMV